jgi:TDG/mug DNA glycosylase family protein
MRHAPGSDMAGRREMLPDVLHPGLRVVFCGTAAGTRSARIGAYYAGPGNRFWPTLAELGLIPAPLPPERFRDAVAQGIGFTDLAKFAHGMDKGLTLEDFDLPRFFAAIRACRPGALAFTSKRAASLALGRPLRAIGFGPAVIEDFPPVHVLPSPSAANGHWARQRQAWVDFAAALPA